MRKQIQLILYILLFMGCEETDDKGLAENQIGGNVTLENQAEHDGIIIYLSGADVGIVTDVNGDYILSIPDTVDTTGIFSIYYYHVLYDLCSLRVEIEENNSIESSEDLCSERYLTDKELEQIFLVNMEIEQSHYTHGDRLQGSVTVTNIFNRAVNVGMLDFSGFLYQYVYLNLANRDYSAFRWANYTMEPGWVILQVGDSIQTSYYWDVCTQDDCSLGEKRTIPGDYYLFFDLNAREGHPYTFMKPEELRTYLRNNHYWLFKWDYVHDPDVVLSRLGFSKIIVQ